MYTFLGIHYSLWAWLLTPFSFLFRIQIYPNSLNSEYFNAFANKKIIYVVPRMSILDLIVLNKSLKFLKQRRVKSKARPNRFRHTAILALKPRKFFFPLSKKDQFTEDVLNLVRYDQRGRENQFVFLPLSVFWSRAAERGEQGFLLRSLFPDDGTGNWIQKLIMLLFHGGHVNIFFGKEFSLFSSGKETLIENEENNSEHEYNNVLKLKRSLHIEFAKERTAAFGPALYDRDKINQWILSTGVTKDIIEASENKYKTKKQIVRYISEISAKYNYMTVRALERMFDFIWNKVFSGVRVRNIEKVERFSKDGQILWMPSHRSHFDYLLLSYVLFKKGLATPHIAAGINLNFWPIGAILRQGGAFFIRRSFAGNKLYAATFTEYVNFLLQNSFPIEFFQEGGRSRIGKLLAPKLGMLSICVQSIISRKAENTYFIPVYFGYDKVMEDDTYARELKGTKKQKENAFQFLNGIRKIFSKYGTVDVSFGEPLKIADIWEDYIHKLKKEILIDPNFKINLPEKFTELPNDIDHRNIKIQGFIKYLSKRINQRINCAATASSTALLTSVLLSGTNHELEQNELKFKVLLLHWLANEFGQKLNWRIATNTDEENIFEYISQHLSDPFAVQEKFGNVNNLGQQYIDMGDKWKFIIPSKQVHNKHEKIFTINMEKELNLWWYRGTVFHIFAGYSIVAFLLLKSMTNETSLTIPNLKAEFSFIRKLWQEELYWDSKTSSDQIVQCCLSIFEQLKFIERNEETLRVIQTNQNLHYLKFLNNFTLPERDMYGIQISAALEIIKQKGQAPRDELYAKAFQLHAKSYNFKNTTIQPIFSKIFASRIFDAFYKHKIYMPGENFRVSIDFEILNVLDEFLNLKKFI